MEEYDEPAEDVAEVREPMRHKVVVPVPVSNPIILINQGLIVLVSEVAVNFDHSIAIGIVGDYNEFAILLKFAILRRILEQSLMISEGVFW